MAVERDKQNERISPEEFVALTESDPDHRYEYIDGYPYMMTGGSPDHAIIGSNLSRILGNLLRRRPCIVYDSAVVFLLPTKDKFCPDVSVSCDRRDRNADKVIQYPCLVIEILSPYTRLHDKGLKTDLYQDCPSVQEILLVDTQIIRIQLYRREKDGWMLRNFAHDSTIELSSLGVQLPVAEVYEKTSFDENFPEEA